MTSKDFQRHASKITDNVVPVGVVAGLLWIGMQLSYTWGGSASNIEQRMQTVEAWKENAQDDLQYLRSAMVRIETRLGTLPDSAWQRWDTARRYGDGQSDTGGG